MPHARACVDGEDHRCSVVPAVLVGERIDARQRARPTLEVPTYRVDQFIVVGLVAVAIDLHMRVDVDGRDPLEIDSVFVLFAGHESVTVVACRPVAEDHLT